MYLKNHGWCLSEKNDRLQSKDIHVWIARSVKIRAGAGIKLLNIIYKLKINFFALPHALMLLEAINVSDLRRIKLCALLRNLESGFCQLLL